MVCLDSLGVYELPMHYSNDHMLTGSCHVNKIRGPTPDHAGMYNHYLFSNLKQGFLWQLEERERNWSLALPLSLVLFSWRKSSPKAIILVWCVTILNLRYAIGLSVVKEPDQLGKASAKWQYPRNVLFYLSISFWVTAFSHLWPVCKCNIQHLTVHFFLSLDLYPTLLFHWLRGVYSCIFSTYLLKVLSPRGPQSLIKSNGLGRWGKKKWLNEIKVTL